MDENEGDLVFHEKNLSVSEYRSITSSIPYVCLSFTFQRAYVPVTLNMADVIKLRNGLNLWISKNERRKNMEQRRSSDRVHEEDE